MKRDEKPYEEFELLGYSVTERDGIIRIEIPKELKSKWDTSRYRLLNPDDEVTR